MWLRLMGQRFEQTARLLGKRMFAAIAGSVQPPDFPRRCFGRQRVEHRQHGGHSDSGTQQNNGPVARPQREAASRGACIHDVANLQLVVDISAGRAMGFPLDAHAIVRSALGSPDSE